MGYHSSNSTNAANAANAANVANAANAAEIACYDEETTQSLLSELSSIIKIKHSGADFSRAFKTIGSSRDCHSANDVAYDILSRNIDTYSIALAAVNLIFNKKIISFKLFSIYKDYDAAIEKIDAHIKDPANVKIYKKLECWMNEEEFLMVSLLAKENKDKIVSRNWADLFNIAGFEYYEIISSDDPFFHIKNKEAQRNSIIEFNVKLLNAAATVRLKWLYDSVVVLSPQEIARQERSRQLDEEYERLKRKEEEKERRRAERTATDKSKKSAEAQPEPPPSSSASESRVEEPQPTEHVYPDADDKAQQAPSGDGSSAADTPEAAPNTDDPADPEQTATYEAEQAPSGDGSSAADMPLEEPHTTEHPDPVQTATYEAEQAPNGVGSSAADIIEETPNNGDPANPIPTSTDNEEQAPTGNGSSAADMPLDAHHPADPEPATQEPEPSYDHEAEFARRQASATKFIADQNLVKKSRKDAMQFEKERLADELSSHYFYIMDTRNNPAELEKLADVARLSGEKINLNNFNGDIATGNRELLRWIFPKVTTKKQSLNARINEWGAALALAEESQWDDDYLREQLKTKGLKKLLKPSPDDGKPSLVFNKELGYWEIRNLPADASLMINGTIVDTINDVAIDEFLFY